MRSTPNNNKPNFDLALAIFHDTTIAACSRCLPERPEVSSFLLLVSCWWNVANARDRYSHNPLTQGITTDDGKIQFYFQLADWIETWRAAGVFCFTKQTATALMCTLRSQAMLASDLLADGYQFVLTRRLQSVKLENRLC